MQSKPLKSETRPWGRFEDFFRTDDVVFKLIYVAPFQRLSLQKHHNRSEVWVCASGEGRALIGSEPITLTTVKLEKGTSLIIREGLYHRLVNDGPDELIVAELQHGFCSEDDIVRISDDYGRVK